MTTAQDRLNQILTSWYDLLTQWSLDGSFVAAATDALMLESSNANQDSKGQLQSYVSKWSAGNFQNLPQIVLLSAADISGARGAYADSTDTIYLNQDWLLGASAEDIQKVLTEELGHYLDDQLTKADTQGDEGEYFSYQLLSGYPDQGLQRILGSENDGILLDVSGSSLAAQASSDSKSWIIPFTGDGIVRVYSSCSLPDGAVIACGAFKGSIDYSGQSLSSRNNSFDIFVIKIGSNGQISWMTTLGGDYLDIPYAITAIDNETFTISGLFQGSISFGPSTLTSSGRSLYQPESRAFIANGSLADGSYSAAIQDKFAIDGGSGISTISANLSNQQIAAGIFQNKIELGSKSAIYATTYNNNDIFIAKRQSNGDFEWVKSFGGSSNDDSVCGAEILADGSSIIYGNFLSNARFNTTTLLSDGYRDGFIISLNTDGTTKWIRQLGGSDNQWSQCLSVSTGGSSYASGRFSGTITLGNESLTSPTGTDAYIASFGPDGATNWIRQISGSSNTMVNSSALTGDGYLIIAGSLTSGDAIFGSTTLSSVSTQAFVAKLDANGSFVWAQKVGNAQDIKSVDVAIDGTILVQGTFAYNLEIGGQQYTSSGSEASFSAHLDENGKWLIVNTGSALISITGATNTSAPAVTENLIASVATADPDGHGSGSFSYTWESYNGSSWDSVGTGSAYTVKVTDEGKQVRLRANYTDGQGFSEQVVTAAGTVAAYNNGQAIFSITGATNTSAPAVTENLIASVATADPDGNGSGSFSYTWESYNGSSWDSVGTGSAYTVKVTDEGKQVRLRANYTDGQGFSEEVVTAAGTVAAYNAGKAVFRINGNGTGTETQNLTCIIDQLDPDGMMKYPPSSTSGYTYQWQVSSDGTNWGTATGTGATTFKYSVNLTSDANKFLRVQVGYTDDKGFAETVFTSAAKILSGTTKNDSFAGTSGIDVTFSGSGADAVATGAGNDFAKGGIGNDTFTGADGDGDDFFDGQTEIDIVNYSASSKGVDIDFVTGLATERTIGGIGKDSFAGIENARGTAGADSFKGSTGVNVFTGSGGADTFTFANAQAFGASTSDRITDMSSDDKIQVSASAFGIVGKAYSFAAVSGTKAVNAASALIVYDTGSGYLYLNKDGATSGLGGGGIFAVLDNKFAGLAVANVGLI